MFSLEFKCSGKDGKRVACKKGKEPNAPNLQGGMSKQNLAGQFHQPAYVERILGLKTKSRLVHGDTIFKTW
jgi:hypothetical protein